MDSTLRNRPFTFRVESIPPGTTPEELIKYFYTEDQPRIQVRSLVPAVDSYELDIRECTATVSFQAVNQSVVSPRLLDEDISIDGDFYGFTPLNQPQEPIAADIIAVTGLAAHAFGSWAHSAQNMWLRDYLPRDISTARVLIYGYPSPLHGNISRSILSDHSTNMIHRLLIMREMAKWQDRPIVFIGHSLGCLIIKKVLCDINGSVGIYSSRLPVRSIIFLGAPHKGLETTALETLVKSQATEDMIRELKPESPTLTELNDKFRHVAQDIDILTCYELSPTKTATEMPDGTWKREGPPIMMVSLDSARQWYPREEFEACNADHIQIARLKRGENGIYPRVRWAIKKALLSAGDLYSETKGCHNGESRNLESMDEASTIRRSLLQVTHRQTSTPSDDHIVRLASTPSRPPSEDTIDQQVRRLDVETSANRGDTQSKSNHFNDISQWCSSVDVSKCDDIQSSTTATTSSEKDQASGLFDEDNATSKSTGFTTYRGVEDPRKDKDMDPATQEDDKITAPKTDDSKISEGGTKSMVMDEVMVSAIIKGDEAKTCELLAHSYDVNCKDDDSMTPLLLAARFKHENILRLLLEQGADSGARCGKGQTTLHWLTMTPSTQITKTLINLLLRNRPPLEAVDGNDRTPLMAACTSGDLLLAIRLIRHGANVRATNQNNATALHIAAYEGKDQIVSMLLNYGAELEAKADGGHTPLHMAAAGPSDPSETVRQLIRAGADKDALDGQLFTPLHRAIKQHNKACVTCLLESNANIEASNNSFKVRPLHMAAQEGRFVKAILDRGANIEAPERDGRRPLHYAAYNGHLEAVKLLLDHGANIEARFGAGRRPLHFAAKEGHLEVMKLLLDRGANIEAPDRDGWRPLQFATVMGQLEAVKVLLDHGANIEAPNRYGWRPLHNAAFHGHLEAVRLLLDHGANPSAKTSKLIGDKPSGVRFLSSVSDEQKQAIRKLLKEAEKKWKNSGKA